MVKWGPWKFLWYKRFYLGVSRKLFGPVKMFFNGWTGWQKSSQTLPDNAKNERLKRLDLRREEICWKVLDSTGFYSILANSIKTCCTVYPNIFICAGYMLILYVRRWIWDNPFRVRKDDYNEFRRISKQLFDAGKLKEPKVSKMSKTFLYVMANQYRIIEAQAEAIVNHVNAQL